MLIAFIPLVYIVATLASYASDSKLVLFVFEALLVTAMLFVFSLLNRRPIQLICGKCCNSIMSNTPWVCGVCGETNLDTVQFPFVHRCEYCAAESKAYKCHHCGELVFLTPDKQKSNYAFCINDKSEPRRPGGDAEAQRHKVRQEQVARAQHEVEIAKLQAELKALQVRVREQEKLSAAELKKVQVEEQIDGAITLTQLYATKKSAIIMEHKNDPRLKRKLLRIVREFEDEGR